MNHHEVGVIGAGPAGLGAALNLVRARRTTLLVDSNRPRNSATFRSHGYPTRDGISPLELRRLGREEVEGYEESTVAQAQLRSVERVDGGFLLCGAGRRPGSEFEALVRVVLLATGLSETLPALPSIRAYYGTSLQSCVECEGWEFRDAPIALIGESDDLAERARHISQWSRDLVVFTNGVGTVSAEDEARLSGRGIRVDRRALADVVGERGAMTGVALADGDVVPRSGGFVRPHWTPSLDFAEGLELARDEDGLVAVDADGRTSAPGVYAAGDLTPPGPQQLIIAAGSGAKVAATINRDLLD